MLIGLGAVALSPARTAVAADEPNLRASIDNLTPTVVSPGDTITMTGTLTNRDDHVWKNVQAYLVIPTAPFTTRAQVDEVLGSGQPYTGRRIIDINTIGALGDLEAGQTVPFTIKVPYPLLGLTGAEGVYPVGVQFLGTDVDGTRSTDAIARATTFLPLVDDVGKRTVETGLVWPFLSPVKRGGDGHYDDVDSFLQVIGPDGRLGRLLDLAASMPATATTILIDPALVQAADDVAQGRRLDEAPTPEQIAVAAGFRDDLLTLARATSSWVLDHDRPDLLAISRDTHATRLVGAVDATTDREVQALDIPGRHVSWPAGDVDRKTLELMRRDTGRSAVLASDSLPGWDRRDGSIVRVPVKGGDMPTFVADELTAGVPGSRTVATVRQGLLAEAALAVLQQGIDDGSHADALVLVPTGWDPGPTWSAADLPGVLDVGWVAPSTPAAQLDSELPAYDGSIREPADDLGLHPTQVDAVTQLLSRTAVLADVVVDRDTYAATADRDAADLLGVRWRADPAASLAISRDRVGTTDTMLADISIEGPNRVTLSSSQGRFPLTIRNGAEAPVRVGIQLDSSNPALKLPAVTPIEVAAGERRTVTVEIDVGNQSSATVTARLVSPEGDTFGLPTVFNVRSSAVGAVLWVAIGLAGLFVAVTLVRRFRGRRGASSAALPESVDD